MKNIGQLIYRYHIFLIFLALQVAALWLLVQNNNYQRSTFINSTNSIVANLYDKRDEFSGFIKLRDRNDELKKENAQLRTYTLGNFNKLEDDVIEINDTLYFQQYAYIPAKVINLSLNSRNNFVTLNKGSILGIIPGMGVTSDGKIVGFVKDVSAHFSSVMPVINSNFEASVKLKKSNELGRLVWDEINPRYARVFEIPNHARISVGDTLITSGFGTYFPEGSLVGVIEEASVPKGHNFYEIKIKLFVDFYKLGYVEVVQYLLKDEQIKLEQQFSEDD